jgi:hypothetical protein
MVLRNLHSLFASPVEKRHPGMAFPQAIVSCLDGQKGSHMTEKGVTFLGEFELLLSQEVEGIDNRSWHNDKLLIQFASKLEVKEARSNGPPAGTPTGA